MKTLLTLLTIITALNSCTPNHKVVYANYTREQADSIVNLIDNTALEMQNIEKWIAFKYNRISKKQANILIRVCSICITTEK